MTGTVVEYGAHNKPVLCTLSTTSTTTITCRDHVKVMITLTTFIDDKSARVFIRGRKQKVICMIVMQTYCGRRLQKSSQTVEASTQASARRKLLRTHGINMK